jgi:magnesium transporter
VIRAWCYTDDAERGNPVDVEALRDVVAKPETLLWIDVEDPTGADIELLARELDIHELTAEDLRKAGQRTKLDRIGHHFHVSAHDCVLADNELQTREIDIVFSESWLVSVRHRGEDGEPPMPIDDALRRFERSRAERGANDEGFLLWALLDVVVDRWFAVADGIDDRLDAAEELVFAEDHSGIPRELFELRRTLVRFRHTVGPLRDVVSALLRREAECLGDHALVHLQDVFDHVLRVMDTVESQREVLTGLLEGRLAVMSNQMNEVMKATSSWGAILIVATLIAGIYGMNFDDMPELNWGFGYPFALGLMLLATGGLYLVFKRRGWL